MSTHERNHIEEHIETLLMDKLSLQQVQVSHIDSHFTIIAVSDCFDGLTPVKQQQMIYAQLMDLIQNNTIHAVTIKPYTVAQWQRQQKLQSF